MAENNSVFKIAVFSSVKNMRGEMFCLFCGADRPASIEHIIPESLGNDDLVLTKDVCAECNQAFSKVENIVLNKSPIAFWRAHLGIRTKKGKLPKVDLSQPAREKGKFGSVHPSHDNVGFAFQPDGSTLMTPESPRVLERIEERGRLQFVQTDFVLQNLSRFLCKVGVEMLCLEQPGLARTSRLHPVRRFARNGEGERWPIFHVKRHLSRPLNRRVQRGDDIGNEVDCYRYLLSLANDHAYFSFGMGDDVWIVGLDDRFHLLCPCEIRYGSNPKWL